MTPDTIAQFYDSAVVRTFMLEVLAYIPDSAPTSFTLSEEEDEEWVQMLGPLYDALAALLGPGATLETNEDTVGRGDLRIRGAYHHIPVEVLLPWTRTKQGVPIVATRLVSIYVPMADAERFYRQVVRQYERLMRVIHSALQQGISANDEEGAE